MANASDKKVNKKSLFLGLSIIIIVGLIGTYRSCTVAKEGVYTITTIYKVQGARGGLRVDFIYTFGNKEYTGYAVNSSYSHNDVGKRLFIKVLPNDPDRCLITDIRVPDSVSEAPPEGWKELPQRLLQASRDNYKENDHAYTIATVFNIQKTNDPDKVIFDYKYNFFGINYTGKSISTAVKETDEGQRFFIQVNMIFADQHTLTSARVPDSITQAPWLGWKELPN